jgi:hypothetical protein
MPSHGLALVELDGKSGAGGGGGGWTKSRMKEDIVLQPERTISDRLFLDKFSPRVVVVRPIFPLISL